MSLKAGYTLPRKGDRILMDAVIARLQEQIHYSIARARYRNACKTVNITAIP